MTLKIGSSLTGGLRRVANRNGLMLTVAYIILGSIWQLLFYSALVAGLNRSGAPTAEAALPSIGVPLPVSVVGALLSLVSLQYLTIVAIRTFVGGHARSIPAAYYTRNIVFVLVNSIVGALVFGVIVVIGSLLLLVPGLIAYVAFIFMLFYVAVEDESFVTAFRDSWALTRGSWLRLFGLLVVVIVGIGVVSGVLSGLAAFVIGSVGGQALGTLVSGIIALPFSLLTLGILAEAFTSLREDQEGQPG